MIERSDIKKGVLFIVDKELYRIKRGTILSLEKSTDSSSYDYRVKIIGKLGIFDEESMFGDGYSFHWDYTEIIHNNLSVL